MLIADCEGKRVEARHAVRELDHNCPKCRGLVILKRGRIVVAHFAHKPNANCDWARGETRAHLEAKQLLHDALAARGLRVEVERVVPSQTGDRRADVFFLSPTGIEVAIELQHTNIVIEEIERRAFSYAGAGIAQAWVPFLQPTVWVDAIACGPTTDGDWFIERYPARSFERWIHGLNHGSIWFYDPGRKMLWCGRFARHEIIRDGGTWYSAEGEEMHGGGYSYWSKRWRELTLWGPHALDAVRVKYVRRRAFRKGNYNWPAGRVVQFVVDRANTI